MYKPHFRCKRNRVPVLANENLEQDAEMFIRDFDPNLLTYPNEIDIDKFSEFYLGLKLRFFYLTSYGGILGRMIFNDCNIPIYLPEEGRADYYAAERGEIMIDSSLEHDDHRIRSTMGHEAAHWIYHQQYYSIDPSQMMFFPDKEKMATTCKRSAIEGNSPKKLVTDQDWLEHQANYFSAAILMPRPAMKLLFNDPSLRREINDYDPDQALDFMTSLVAEIFNVSEKSARIRIEQLDLKIKKEADPYKMFILAEDLEEIDML